MTLNIKSLVSSLCWAVYIPIYLLIGLLSTRKSLSCYVKYDGAIIIGCKAAIKIFRVWLFAFNSL